MSTLIFSTTFGSQEAIPLISDGRKAPASGTRIDTATGPQGRGGTALPPADASSKPLAPTTSFRVGEASKGPGKPRAYRCRAKEKMGGLQKDQGGGKRARAEADHKDGGGKTGR